MLKNDNVLRIAAYLIVALLGLNFFFFKSVLSDSKEEDKILTTKIETVSGVAAENKSDIKVLNNDIKHFKTAVDEIKTLIDKKLEKK